MNGDTLWPEPVQYIHKWSSGLYSDSPKQLPAPLAAPGSIP